MASLQAHRVRGHTYWRIVESRRVNGKPRAVPVAYLGKADDLLARLRGTEKIQVASKSHGAVAALWALANELDVAGTIDRHMKTSGRRVASKKPAVDAPKPPRSAQRRGGMTVGQSLVLAAIGRACHATSKRGFSEWAKTTTMGELAGVNVEVLTSQHFWDQMDQLPIETIALIEGELVERTVDTFSLSLDTLLYDATNFFTFIASTNTRPELPARGHQKQKRDDLRQVSVAVLCSQRDGIPLFHRTYGGQVADATSFRDLLPAISERLTKMQTTLESMTLVYDKGNVSRANQKRVDAARLHYVTAMTVASQRKLVDEANSVLTPIDIGDGEQVPAYRTRRVIWGVERTAVVVVSERLRQGQMRGILQHVESATRWLERLASTLKRGKQKRNKVRIDHDIRQRLSGRQHLRETLRVDLSGEDPHLSLTWQFDQSVFEKLTNTTLGRIVLVTDRDAWSTSEILHAYRSQATIEAVFAHLKDPRHIMLRPQFHWTDQKLHVHVFICLLSYLLARLLYLRARRATTAYGSPEALLDALERVRHTRVVHLATGEGTPRITEQLEEVEPQLADLLSRLGIES